MKRIALASSVCALLLAACDAHAQRATSPWARLAQGLGIIPSREAHARRQWDHLARVDGAQCRARLRAAGVVFRAMPDRDAPDARGCGIPHGVVLLRGPTGIRYEGGVPIDCTLALRIPAFEAVVQSEARARLGAPVTRVGTFGSYNCRPMRGWSGSLSEHAFGDAIDIARFGLRRGREVTVLRDYRGDDARGRFLRDVYARLRGEAGFAHVRGPDDDALHRDHFHVDGGVGWWER